MFKTSTKPVHAIYQQYYEQTNPTPNPQQILKSKVPYQVIPTNPTYTMNPDELEIIIQKQVPYYHPQSIAKTTAAAYAPTVSTTTPTPSTVTTPLYRVHTTPAQNFVRGFTKFPSIRPKVYSNQLHN